MPGAALCREQHIRLLRSPASSKMQFWSQRGRASMVQKQLGGVMLRLNASGFHSEHQLGEGGSLGLPFIKVHQAAAPFCSVPSQLLLALLEWQPNSPWCCQPARRALLTVSCLSHRPDDHIGGHLPRAALLPHHHRHPECLCVPGTPLLLLHHHSDLPPHQRTQGMGKIWVCCVPFC